MLLFLLACGRGTALPTAPLTEPNPDTVMVIVAAVALEVGVPIAEEHLIAIRIPPAYLPGGVYLSPDHVVGQVPIQRMLPMEFIRAEFLANPELGKLSSVLPRQMRAVVVPIEGDRPEPASYVDVWGEEDCRVAQAVFVLAVEGTSAYLLAISEEAGRIQLASRTRAYRLEQRADDDLDFREGACSSL